MSDMNDKLLTDYMIGRCRQGFDYISMYLAATLFERLVGSKLKNKNPTKFEEISADRSKTLNDIIIAIKDQMGLNRDIKINIENQISYSYIFRSHIFFRINGSIIGTERTAYEKLRDFKNLRNDIIHAENPEKLLSDREHEIIDLMLYVASENTPELFRDILSKISPRNIIGLRTVLDGTSADYLVRSVDEVMIKRFDQAEGINRKSWKIEDEDFSNLFHLRKKLVPLKNTLDKWLEEHHPELATTILTTIDTASAYVWLPIVPKDQFKKDNNRPNLDNATISIMATPLDFRIYIDFGGHCLPDRKAYFKFIKNSDGEFKHFLKGLNATDREIFSVFDVEWYSFITKSILIEDILNEWNQWKSTVNEAEKELCQLEKNYIITKNRLLSGFIYNRDWIKNNGPIKENLVLEKLHLIIDLYNEFLSSKKLLSGESHDFK